MTTLSSRPRVAHNSRRGKQKILEPVIVSEEEDEEEEEEEEESAEDESVTRCVCGKQHSIGLMVCCDDCEVWQHCECMGLEEEDIPDQYFCEQCRPEDHVQIKGYDNKTRRYYKPSKAIKKRSTFNSRETSIPLDDIKGVTEPSCSSTETTSDSPTEGNENKSSRSKRKSTKNEKKSRSSSTSTNNSRKWVNNSLRRSHKAPRSRTSTPQPETPTLPSTSSILLDHLSPSARETSPPAKVRTPSSRMTISEMNKRANQILEYICSLQVEINTGKKRKEKKLLQEEEDGEDGEDNEEDVLCKRRKLIEAQINETMTRTLVQLEQEEKYNVVAATGIRESRKPTPILIPRQFDHASSPSSSLSSASTIPLEEEEELFVDTEKSIAEEALERMNNSKSKDEQTSLEIMDILTRKVIVFQRRFGQFSFGNAMTDDPESIEYEGPPITRSREFYQGRNTW
ncbi:hypothetical protein G6F62_009029 [Rhizopus arrhizus]|nr:hypothetical protein G6F22_008685 [Rhizopus arrhizus]KAG1220544.1 hypothetical protein G6F35_006629 [Rhizopus arrhizus]KAG1324558.1 hypothetical protein G6F62_009029 [Rhizopus arrhizus]